MSAEQPTTPLAPGSASGRPDVSVVVVSYNTRELLDRCLGSIQRGAGALEIETFVVDNASHDGSAELVKSEHPSVRLIANDDNLGFAAANNQAIAQATGEFVLLLNPDTELQPDALPTCVRHMREHPEVGVLGCRVTYPNGAQQSTLFRLPRVRDVFIGMLVPNRWMVRSRRLGRSRYVGIDLDRIQDVEVVAGCFMLVPRVVIDEVGPLDDDFFMYAEEAEWCFRIARSGRRVRYLPTATIVHLEGQSAKQVSDRMAVVLAESQLLLFQKTRGRLAERLAAGLMVVRDLPRWLAYHALGAFGFSADASPRISLRPAVVRLPLELRRLLSA